MPEYVAKAWYRDLAIWVSILTIISGWLASPEVAGLIPQRVLSLMISGIGLVTLIVRSISTARPVGMSDGSRSVKVHHLSRKAKSGPTSVGGYQPSGGVEPGLPPRGGTGAVRPKE